jgi:hypothetical protein
MTRRELFINDFVNFIVFWIALSWLLGVYQVEHNILISFVSSWALGTIGSIGRYVINVKGD